MRVYGALLWNVGKAKMGRKKRETFSKVAFLVQGDVKEDGVGNDLYFYVYFL